ncbi:hypothetical protein cgR_0741 [Corynebacterium glutamicum R]|uniref:Secreted protein n=1 Tax=Corynebacterium glutamicum (strain R) TaxID=340322 RepID=A0AB72V8R6_CORGB|nr:hypothetical protein cgR_0741 [Corynebacterium glutamicum R]
MLHILDFFYGIYLALLLALFIAETQRLCPVLTLRPICPLKNFFSYSSSATSPSTLPRQQHYGLKHHCLKNPVESLPSRHSAILSNQLPVPRLNHDLYSYKHSFFSNSLGPICLKAAGWNT